MTTVDDRPATPPAPAPRRRQPAAGAAAQLVAAAHQHAYRAGPAVPARGGRDPRLGAAAARGQPGEVNAYFADHPEAGAGAGPVGAFEVFASPWFSAIYLLLFVSLIGCIVPRLRDHLRALRAAAGRAAAAGPAAPARGAGRPGRRRPGGDRGGAAPPPVAGRGTRRHGRPPRRATSRRPATCCSTSRWSPCWSGSRSAPGTAGTATACWWPARTSAFCNTLQQYAEAASAPAWTRRPAAVLPELEDFEARYLAVRAGESFPPRSTGRPRTAGRAAHRRLHGELARCGWMAPTSTCSATATRRCCGTPTGTAGRRPATRRS